MTMMVVMVMIMNAVTVYVAGMGNVEMHSEFWCGRLKEGDHLEELGIDRCIKRVLEMVLKKQNGMARTGLI